MSFQLVSNNSSYNNDKKELSNTTTTAVSTPGFLKKLVASRAQRSEMKNLEKQLKLERKATEKKNSSDASSTKCDPSLNQVYLVGPYFKAPCSRL